MSTVEDIAVVITLVVGIVVVTYVANVTPARAVKPADFVCDSHMGNLKALEVWECFRQFDEGRR